MTAPKPCAWHPHDAECTEPVVATAHLEQFSGRVCAPHLDRLREIAAKRGSSLTHRKVRAAV